ncbi:autophagy-related protein 16-1 isoform X2 [Ischnura elegans]|uniref:autophagy-related protein 16-1 isoform X2 n=1 Tax=Ischnura elegans TaxID=197161 RepID=UPI001ED8806E|nr:autophagy-related protein 16-1 isoform X2 [Ischnura elegans]
MAASLMERRQCDWRNEILLQLQMRDKTQCHCFKELIKLHNRIFESSNTLRAENLQLSIQNERLRIESLEINQRTSSVDGKVSEKIQILEQRLLHQQEELTELHRRKGENAQQLIDLNICLQDKEKKLAMKEASLSESNQTIEHLNCQIHSLKTNISELERLNQMLKDEHQALQLAFASLEEKLRKTQDENRELVERLISIKSRDADRMNEEHEGFVRKRQQKMQRELEDAAREGGSANRGSHGSNFGSAADLAFLGCSIPTGVILRFDAHDGEVNAVKWSPVDRLLATGGADRKVKLWDVSKGVMESRGILVGSNAAVMSVDFDSTGTLILGSSNDFASRVWTVADQRLRHTLTGHCGKVLAAKFLGEPSKVVSGSHDRTLKVWDLRSRACIETKFAGSSCNDLVTCDSSGSAIISGHFDKRIRFWDARMGGDGSSTAANDIVLQGKVTSLDLSRDGNYLLCCVRDDSLKRLDLRMNQIIGSYSADGFKVGCDWARATFSPDGNFISVGGADGSVFIWCVSTGRLVATLKDVVQSRTSSYGPSPTPTSAAVTAVSWHPHGSSLVSVDRAKQAIVWGNDGAPAMSDAL